MENRFSIAKQLIENIFGLSVRLLADQDSRERFCRDSILLPVQEFSCVENLQKLTDSVQESEICYVQDQLQIDWIFFRLEDRCLVLGPFCTSVFSRGDCIEQLRKLGLPISLYDSLLSYRDRFPLLTTNRVFNIAASLAKVLTAQEYRFRTVDFTQAACVESIKSEENTLQQQYPQFIQEHYAAEQQFMHSVESGDRINALVQLRHMQRGFQSFKKLGTTLENERIASAIVRTMVRIAAMHSGLPTLSIDLLSRANTVATKNAASVDEIYTAKEKMVAEFCNAIQKHRQQGYGNLVSSVVFYMENQYDEPLTVAQLAREFHISQNHLTTVFHKETGQTPTDYLRRIRTEKARQLLLTTNLSVQKISEKIGIDDSNYFVKLFRKDYGAPPTQYRKQHKG